MSVRPTDCFTSVLRFILQLQDASLESALQLSIFAIVLRVSTKTVCQAIFLIQTDRSEHQLLLQFQSGLKLTNRTELLTDIEKTFGKSVKFTFDLFSLFSLMKMSEMKTNHVQPSIAQHIARAHSTNTPPRI